MNILKSRKLWLTIGFILLTIALGFCQKPKKVSKSDVPEWKRCDFTKKGATFECELQTTYTTKGHIQINDRTDNQLVPLKKGVMWLCIDSLGKGKIIYDCTHYVIIKTIPLQSERGTLCGFLYITSTKQEIVNRGNMWEIPKDGKIHSIAALTKCREPSYYETVARGKIYLAKKNKKYG